MMTFEKVFCIISFISSVAADVLYSSDNYTYISTTNSLRGKVTNRKLNAGIPTPIDINVICVNETSNCGINGQCRVTGNGSYCKCDRGYHTVDSFKPCNVKGESQLSLAVLWYIFGWTGASAFVLGWIWLGVGTLVTFCCGCCCISNATDSKTNRSDERRCVMYMFGAASYIACFGLWIYIAVMISQSDTCVDNNGVKCTPW